MLSKKLDFSTVDVKAFILREFPRYVECDIVICVMTLKGILKIIDDGKHIMYRARGMHNLLIYSLIRLGLVDFNRDTNTTQLEYSISPLGRGLLTALKKYSSKVIAYSSGKAYDGITYGLKESNNNG
jgi:hypothetical protein